jgi:hypothetical protein
MSDVCIVSEALCRRTTRNSMLNMPNSFNPATIYLEAARRDALRTVTRNGRPRPTLNLPNHLMRLIWNFNHVMMQTYLFLSIICILHTLQFRRPSQCPTMREDRHSSGLSDGIRLTCVMDRHRSLMAKDPPWVGASALYMSNYNCKVSV